VVILLYDKIKELNLRIESLISEKKIIQKQIERYEDENLNNSIDFISENNAENLSLLIEEVVFIKSANNYVEILYLEGDQYKKKIIRNTLKDIELQIKQYTNFIRCHRICIVNTHYIEKLVSSYNNYAGVIRGYDEQIPVSLQLMLKIKEAI
jgi:DNA-binding LytR/AlgR family response regulator